MIHSELALALEHIKVPREHATSGGHVDHRLQLIVFVYNPLHQYRRVSGVDKLHYNFLMRGLKYLKIESQSIWVY